MSTSRLPLELQLLVIDHLGAGTANDWQSDPEDIDLDLYSDGGIHFRTLYRCALTCRVWLFRCQIHLYRNVQIVSANGLTVLRDTLGRNTTLCGYVRGHHQSSGRQRLSGATRHPVACARFPTYTAHFPA